MRIELLEKTADGAVKELAVVDRLHVVPAHEVENTREQRQVREAGGRKATQGQCHQPSGEEGQKESNPVTSHETGSTSDDLTHAVSVGVTAEHSEAGTSPSSITTQAVVRQVIETMNTTALRRFTARLPTPLASGFRGRSIGKNDPACGGWPRYEMPRWRAIRQIETPRSLQLRFARDWSVLELPGIARADRGRSTGLESGDGAAFV